MKQKIISLVTPEIAEHAQCFIDNQREYAARHGYEYELTENKIWDMHPSFSKVPIIESNMKQMADGDLIIYLDADVAVMDYRVDIGGVLKNRPDKFWACLTQQNWASWRYLCNGIILARVGDPMRRFMVQWIDYCINGVPNVEPGRRIVMRDPPWEQYSHDQCIREWNYEGIYPANNQELGAFCKNLWHDGVIWDRTMPLLHFATSSWDRRAAIFKKDYAHLVIK